MKRKTSREHAVNVEFAGGKLARAEDILSELAHAIKFRRPYHPVWSKDFTRGLATAGTLIYEASRHLEEAGLNNIAEALEYAGMGLDNIYRFLKNVEGLCNFVWKHGLIVHPNPCKYTGSSKLKEVVLDFEKAIGFLKRRDAGRLIGIVDEITLMDPLLYIRDASAHLSTFYSRCETITRRKCTAYESEIADSLNLSLVALALDIASALRYIATILADEYSVLNVVNVSDVPVAYHPLADPELLEAVIVWANASGKLRQMGAYSPTDLGDLMAVVMKDHAWIKLSAIIGHLAQLKHPMWTVEHHSKDENVNMVLKRLYESRGFRAELASYGLKVTVPPGKLKEALAILTLATSMDFRIMDKTLEEAYSAEKARMDRLLGELKML